MQWSTNPACWVLPSHLERRANYATPHVPAKLSFGQTGNQTPVLSVQLQRTDVCIKARYFSREPPRLVEPQILTKIAAST